MPLDIKDGLVERARSGGEGLERLIAAVWPEAYRISLSMLRDTGLAEDSAQDACAAIARSLASLKNASAFPAWSYKIIVNHAIATARRRPRTQALETIPERGSHYDRSDAMDLYAALGKLPIVQRGAVVLHYYAGLSSSDIAAATGLPSSTIRFHLMLARRTLRKALFALETRAARPAQEALHDAH